MPFPSGYPPSPKGYPNKPVIILVPKLHGIRDIYSVHPISFHSFLPSLRRQSLGTLNLRNGIARLIKLIARYQICYRISHSFPGTGPRSRPIVSNLSSHPFSDTNDVGIKVDAGCAGVDFFNCYIIVSNRII